MDSNKNLHKTVIDYINYEINTMNYSADCLESLEVAKQCLENVWNVENSTPSDNISQFFESYPMNNVENVEVDEDDKKAAERLKTQGNICMGENLFSDAVSCYSKAIELDPRNAVYYCNRAAAYSKLNKNENAIEDCQSALKIDSKYGKAYSRMGLAYTGMGKFDEAIVCYKRAIEIEPDNQNYKQNLQAAEERKSSGIPPPTSSTNAGAQPIPNIQSALQNFDLSSILNNPMMMNMAQQMMSQPEMRNMMTQMMQSMIPPGSAAPANDENRTGNGDSRNPDGTNLNNFLAFGQQMAQQMQSANPELIDSLRNRLHETPSNIDNNNKDDNQEPSI